MEPGALILVSMVQPLPQDSTFRRRRLEWPLHVTIVPWFTVPDEGMFLNQLESFVRTCQPFELVIGADEQFGPNRDVPVSIIATQAPVRALHNELMSSVLSAGGALAVSSQWVGEAYRAHVTQHDEVRLREGESIAVSEVTVVRLLEGDICEVVTNVRLGGK